MKKQIFFLNFLKLIFIILIIGTIAMIILTFSVSVTFNSAINIEEPTEIDPFKIAIIGTDYGENRPTAEGVRSDTIIVAEVTPENSRGATEVNTISIPRDTYTYMPCAGFSGKITEASSYGYTYGYDNHEPQDIEAAISCTLDSAEILLDTDIDYYVGITFDTFIDVVDAVGGIKITLPESQESFCEQDENDNPDAYCFESGETRQVDGSEALAYARNRSASSASVREVRQQQIIGAVIEKVLSNPEQYGTSFTSAVLEGTENNLNLGFLTNLLTFGTGYLNYNLNKISADQPFVIDIKSSAYSNEFISVESMLGIDKKNYQKYEPADLYDTYFDYEQNAQWFNRIILNKDQLNIPATVSTTEIASNGTNADLEIQMISPVYEDQTIEGKYYSMLTTESHLYIQQVFGDGDEELIYPETNITEYASPNNEITDEVPTQE